MMTLDTLNAKFGLPGHISFKEKTAGFVVAEVTNAAGTASIAIQGAQVIRWAPTKEKPVIWLSTAAKFAPGKSVRGGVPICWPWFGAHATDSTFPGHGYARTVYWEPVATKALSDTQTQLVFRLVESDTTRKQWPHTTPVECHITVGVSLEVELVTRNADKIPVTITEALHTYFEVEDVRQVKVLGLENTDYLDKVEGGKRKQQAGAITIASEVDRVYLDTTAECIIDDVAGKRRIHITKQNSQSTVVWNPWIDKATKMGDLGENGYLKMLCVESGNAADNTVTIQPGSEHRLSVSYRVSR